MAKDSVSNRISPPGDIVTLHHNVFRRWHDVRGKERNSRSFLEEGKYLVTQDQIYLYKRDGDWVCPRGYCFVQPIKDKNHLSVETEKPLVGIVKYSDGTVEVGDLVGFVASITLRGINFIQIPTTLLSQVDSSVGGKTGVNTPIGKNLIGSFYQPALVISDVGMLKSLKKREVLSGYAEVIKYGIIMDKAFFNWLLKNDKHFLKISILFSLLLVTHSHNLFSLL